MSSTADHGGELLPVRPSGSGAVVSSWKEPPPEEEGSPPPRIFTARILVRALRRYWWQMLLLWGAASATLIVLAYTRVRPSYDAIAWLEVKPPPKELFGGSMASGDNQMETQVQLITSPDVLSAAAKDPKVADLDRIRLARDAEAEMREAVRVQIMPRTTLINVFMSSQSPDEAARIVNAVVEAYDKTARSWTDSRAQDQIRELQQLKAAIQSEVGEAQDTLRRLFARSRGVEVPDDPPPDHPRDGPPPPPALDLDKLRSRITLDELRRRAEELGDIDRQLFEAHSEASRLRARLPAAAPGAATVDDRQLQEALAADPELSAAATQLQQARQQEQEAARRSVRPGDPLRAAAQQKREEAAARHQKLRHDREPILRRRLLSAGRGPVDDEDQRALRTAEDRVALLGDRKTYLEQQLKALRLENQAAGTEALELQFAQLDFNRAQAKLDMVAKTLDQLDYEIKHGQARVTIISKARPPAQPSSDQRLRLMCAAPVGVLAAVLGAFVLLEARAGRVADPQELSGRVHLGVLGLVPPLPSPRATRGPWGRHPDRLRAQLEAFLQSLDHLRVALCAGIGPEGARRVVLITSACGGEGKTTLAAHLAGRCANAGLRTLLIDADLRRPGLATLLGTAVGPGLADVLAGRVEAEAVLIPIGDLDANGFHLLPAGTTGTDPSRLLQGPRLGQVVTRFRDSFDFIIVDAPPVLAVPDALLMGRWTDGAVMAVRHDASRLPLVEQANRRLARVGVPVLGVVINGVRTAAGYGYHNSYYSHHPDSNSGSPDADREPDPPPAGPQ
jgi:succinoglycan biosynthesis transport protein ExoP